MTRPDTGSEQDGEMKVVLSASLWAQIVFRVNESDDDYLRQLVEQAAAGAGSLDVFWRDTAWKPS